VRVVEEKLDDSGRLNAELNKRARG